ncbi:hypothetical protein C7974DRAFT_124705 [Boeremia exigua]|uniref:uncharacterized protein n=1 Tax=Boeremia exigua TaxID=749465 RepID=UPI001E8CA2B2|nr:uncharacterized protein C7974DRAFT_124705 [Boeremia exigua]KAH6639003.1 hypothetical protein C7974DRAFT_124705 [Boeremia exigua]
MVPISSGVWLLPLFPLPLVPLHRPISKIYKQGIFEVAASSFALISSTVVQFDAPGLLPGLRHLHRYPWCNWLHATASRSSAQRPKQQQAAEQCATSSPRIHTHRARCKPLTVVRWSWASTAAASTRNPGTLPQVSKS